MSCTKEAKRRRDSVRFNPGSPRWVRIAFVESHRLLGLSCCRSRDKWGTRGGDGETKTRHPSLLFYLRTRGIPHRRGDSETPRPGALAKREEPEPSCLQRSGAQRPGGCPGRADGPHVCTIPFRFRG